MSTTSIDRTDDATKRLETYLRDHFAGSTGGLALAKRCRDSNVGTPYEPLLLALASEIDEDRQSLRAIMSRLGVAPSEVKSATGAIAEVVGRLKTNGHLLVVLAGRPDDRAGAAGCRHHDQAQSLARPACHRPSRTRLRRAGPAHRPGHLTARTGARRPRARRTKRSTDLCATTVSRRHPSTQMRSDAGTAHETRSVSVGTVEQTLNGVLAGPRRQRSVHRKLSLGVRRGRGCSC